MPDVYPEVAQLAAREISRQSPRLTGALSRSPQPSGGPGEGTVMLPKEYTGTINYGYPARGIEGRRFVERARDIVRVQITRRLDDGLQKVLNRVKGA
jgi:hypothetical protein